MKPIKYTAPDPQARWLEDRAKQLGIAVSELVRRIVDAHIEQQGRAQGGNAQ